MVVTVSGAVGSGKSTVASAATDVLRLRGHGADLLRFQSLPCFTLLRAKLAPPATTVGESGTAATAPGTVRWVGYELRRLGARTALVYLARIIAFRIYSVGWGGRRVHVLNRYFYDLFPTYRLDSPAERFWLRALRAAIPKPDLAIVVAADAPFLAARRPEYAPEFLTASSTAYAKLRDNFPNLVEIRNDAGVPELLECVERLLQGHIE